MSLSKWLKAKLDVTERYKALYTQAAKQRDKMIGLFEKMKGMYEEQQVHVDRQRVEINIQRQQLVLLRGELAQARRGIDTRSGGESTQFDQEEIRKLIWLAHPDKHDGKPAAQEMTQKLLRMRHTIQ